MIDSVAVEGEVSSSPCVEAPVRVLLRLAARAQLYRSADGSLHAKVPIGERHEIYGVRSIGFRDWLVDAYFAEREEPPSGSLILRVVSLLEARARFDGGTPSVSIRVAHRKEEADRRTSWTWATLPGRL